MSQPLKHEIEDFSRFAYTEDELRNVSFKPYALRFVVSGFLFCFLLVFIAMFLGFSFYDVGGSFMFGIGVVVAFYISFFVRNKIMKPLEDIKYETININRQVVFLYTCLFTAVFGLMIAAYTSDEITKLITPKSSEMENLLYGVKQKREHHPFSDSLIFAFCAALPTTLFGLLGIIIFDKSTKEKVANNYAEFTKDSNNFL